MSVDPVVPSSVPLDADEILATKWVVPILRALREEPARFSRIKDIVTGVSANLLATRLRYLEEIGVVQRVELPRPASCQVYQLTDLGVAAIPVLDAMTIWSKTLSVHEWRAPGGA